MKRRKKWLSTVLASLLLTGAALGTSPMLPAEKAQAATGAPLTGGLHVMAGGETSFVQKDDGTLWAFGMNGLGSAILGFQGGNQLFPAYVPNMTDVKTVKGGGNNQTLFLKGDGTVWASGNNNYGDVGVHPSIKNFTHPVQVPYLEHMTDVAAGYTHSLGLREDGTVWAWGQNESGELGDGTTTDTFVPVQVKGLTHVTGIAAGDRYSLAVKSDGTVWAWGYNAKGCLGNGTQVNSAEPVQVQNVDNVQKVSTHTDHVLALKDDGTVWAWGSNTSGALGTSSRYVGTETLPQQVLNLTDAVDVQAGYVFSMALKRDGTVWTWGDNGYGQLGTGLDKYKLTWSTTPYPSPILTDVREIAAGNKHALAVKNDGTVWAWGDDSWGQLGDNTKFSYSNQISPVQAVSLFDVQVDVKATSANTTELQVAANQPVYKFKVTSGPRVICEPQSQSASCNDQNLKTGTDATYVIEAFDANDASLGKKQVTVQTLKIKMAAGDYHKLLVKEDGTIWSTGFNAYGQLGLGASDTQNRKTLEQITTLSGMTDAAGGTRHSLARKSDGTVYAWGSNEWGQLGVGASITESETPVQLKMLERVERVITSANTSYALKTDGTVWAWGNNKYGQLGVGDTVTRYEPVKVPLTDIVDIAAGSGHTLFLARDGTVYAAGRNDYGQLGIGSTTPSSTPVKIPSFGATKIAVGSLHSLAIMSNGNAVAWGYNKNGQLGNGQMSTAPVTSPSNVYGGAYVAAIAGGYGHTVFQKTDGTIWATGYNFEGQLGNNSRVNAMRPVQVVDADGKAITGVDQWTTGGRQGFAHKTDGGYIAWGSSSYGELADGTTTRSTTPIVFESMYNLSLYIKPEYVTQTSIPVSISSNTGSVSKFVLKQSPLPAGKTNPVYTGGGNSYTYLAESLTSSTPYGFTVEAYADDVRVAVKTNMEGTKVPPFTPTLNGTGIESDVETDYFIEEKYPDVN